MGRENTPMGKKTLWGERALWGRRGEEDGEEEDGEEDPMERYSWLIDFILLRQNEQAFLTSCLLDKGSKLSQEDEEVGGETLWGETPMGRDPNGERPYGERPYGERPYGERYPYIGGETLWGETLWGEIPLYTCRRRDPMGRETPMERDTLWGDLWGERPYGERDPMGRYPI